ncbi:MAG: DUF5069 domain-containing protein [Vulcanimicrobiaceae bacterium]
MDLTKNYPRSAREKIGGVVMVARTIDKGRGYLAGTVGEYRYDCPMDQKLFAFLGVEPEPFLAAVRNSKDDTAVASFLAPYVAKKTPAELERFNQDFLRYGPQPGTESYDYFVETRNAAAPDRTDVTGWVDLLDLDEKRAVPRRVAA